MIFRRKIPEFRTRKRNSEFRSSQKSESKNGIPNQVINAEQQGNDAPSELRMEVLLNEEVGRDREGDYEKDAGDITIID